MKRSSSDIKRLIRAQQAMAAMARVEHAVAADALVAKSGEIASLERWAAEPDARALPLLDFYVERARGLAAEKAMLAAREKSARERLVGETARVKPLERAAARARQAEERTATEKQFEELLDRQFSAPNQVSRKPRRP
ncbi:MAG: hypothetical protein JJ920_00660 [Roseitalea sp.]|jgi:hypothetical protein|nr:hypothetical protein [Roseitalea sp.]MBO6741389.1 hypothetical protein [Roseitalea sp.]